MLADLTVRTCTKCLLVKPIRLEVKDGRGGGPSSPSLDRLRPELGYVRGNICVISNLANRIKSNATSAEELEHVAAWMRSQGL